MVAVASLENGYTLHAYSVSCTHAYFIVTHVLYLVWKCWRFTRAGFRVPGVCDGFAVVRCTHPCVRVPGVSDGFAVVPIRCRQLDLLRKQVASLEEAIQAKDRENVTNRTMYDNMKGVSRKIKEVMGDERTQAAIVVD